MMTEKERHVLALSKSRNSSKQRRLKHFADTIHEHPLWLQFMGLIESSEIKGVHYWAGNLRSLTITCARGAAQKILERQR